jgi:hypothetical protein
MVNTCTDKGGKPEGRQRCRGDDNIAETVGVGGWRLDFLLHQDEKHSWIYNDIY